MNTKRNTATSGALAALTLALAATPAHADPSGTSCGILGRRCRFDRST
jgi:hypothetical protein